MHYFPTTTIPDIVISDRCCRMPLTKYILAMHLVELMICTITSHYVIIKEKNKRKGKI